MDTPTRAYGNGAGGINYLPFLSNADCCNRFECYPTHQSCTAKDVEVSHASKADNAKRLQRCNETRHDGYVLSVFKLLLLLVQVDLQQRCC